MSKEIVIEGYVQLKRIAIWVNRYAEITNGSLYYYKNKGDSRPSQVYSLTGSSAVEQIVSTTEFHIQFISNADQGHQRILFRFETQAEERKWLKVFRKVLSSTSSSNSNPPTANSQSANASPQTSQKYPVLPSQPQQQTQHQRNNTQHQQPDKLPTSSDSLAAFQESTLANSTRSNQNKQLNNQGRFDRSFITVKNDSTAAQLLLSIKSLKANRFDQSNLTLVNTSSSLRVFADRSTINSQRFAFIEFLMNIPQDLNEFSESIQSSRQLQVIFLTGLLVAAIFVYQLSWSLNLSWTLYLLLQLIAIALTPSCSLQLCNIFTNPALMNPVAQLNCMATGILPLNINEFLTTLTSQPSQRQQFHVGVVACSHDKGTFKLTFIDGGHQTFAQEVFADQTHLYITESAENKSEATNTNNSGFLRVFEIPLETAYLNQLNINYYYLSASPTIFTRAISDSHTILQAIVSFVHSKRTYNSSIFGEWDNHMHPTADSLNTMSIVSAQSLSPSVQSMHVEQTAPSTNSHQANGQTIQSASQPVLESISPAPTAALPVTTTATQPKPSGSSGALLPYQLQGAPGAKYNDLLKSSLDCMKQYAPLSNENNWTVIDSKPDYKTHTRLDQPTQILMSRGEVIIAKPIKFVVEYIKNAATRSGWDDMFKESKEIERFNESTSIEHNMFKGVLLVSGRDLCLIQSHFEIEGTYYFIGSSVVHSGVPENKKFVRANLKVGGWIINSVEGGTKTNCIYITCCDPCGGLSSSLKEYAAKQQGLNASKLKKVIEKLK